MGFHNPGISWTEFNRRLGDGRPSNRPPHADGGDSPAWSRRRLPYVPPAESSPDPASIPYAELHCHSNFSFLDGASHPETLAEEAVHLGLRALALTDRDGLYGVVRFSEAARAVGMPTMFGAELTIGAKSSTKPQPDPVGQHLVVIARDPSGYARLARAISHAQSKGKKNAPLLTLDDLGDAHNGSWLVLTGCRKGIVPSALATSGTLEATHQLGGLVERFGKDNVLVEVWDHGEAFDVERNVALSAIAQACGVDAVVTNNVHYAMPGDAAVADTLAAIRARSSLDDIRGWLPASGLAHLRSGDEQAKRFAHCLDAVHRTAEIAEECAFDLKLVAPRLPDFPVPEGHDEMSWLRHLVEQGADRLYGPRNNERVKGAYAQIDYELGLIEQLGFPGYFLIVWDIVDFCRRSNIYCQGRGSAANSAVCYALGITPADAVKLGLLFERFMSPERDGPPDIDLDIESHRREEAIQYVYQRYGRQNAAQVANVITYRPKLAVRDVARAFGHDPGRIDAWTKQVDGWQPLSKATDTDVPGDVLELARRISGFPRHLGIHSGGMVICDRPVIEVCPVEWARMKDRSVLQWDKDDCAATGLVKFDLLGLGMLSVLHNAVDLVAEHHEVMVELATLPQDDAVYDMLCKADTVGIFQVESRAQMATLPRLKPRKFYDLVVEVALIRPGPIQGGSVHPYIRRRNGQEKVTYLHPLLEPSLRKTLGVPLFQEQLMQMAIDVAGFSAAEADQLRQAMGSKRSAERMERLRQRLYDGMAKRGITGSVADQIYEKLAAFANFGFPESHSVSFAYLVYASAWFKCHYPAAYLAACLNGQPMGFWSPATLIADARRHGVTVLHPDVNRSASTADLEGHETVRLGLRSVRALSDEVADHIADLQPFVDMADFVRRTDVSIQAIEALATAGAFSCFGLDRRGALWAAGALSQSRSDRLEGVVIGADSPELPAMTDLETSVADMWATGVTPDSHLVSFVRDHLDGIGATRAVDLERLSNGSRIIVGGIITHRQRPATASGITFLSVEDETGLMNIVCHPGFWKRHRQIANSAAGVVIHGRLESAEGVINIVAERMSELPIAIAVRSRNFH